MFCSALIVLTAAPGAAAELDISDTESEFMMASTSLSLLHMTVVRVTQVTRRRDTRLIRRARMTSEVREEEVLSSGSVAAAIMRRDWN